MKPGLSVRKFIESSVWWADLGSPIGSRPVVIIRENIYFGSVTVAECSRTKKDYSTIVVTNIIEYETTYISCHSLRTIPLSKLYNFVGILDATVFSDIKHKLSVAFKDTPSPIFIKHLKGTVWYADGILEKSKLPVIVISNNEMNIKCDNVIVINTSHKNRLNCNLMVPIFMGNSTSYACCGSVYTLHKRCLTDYMGTLNQYKQDKISDVVKKYLMLEEDK